MFTSEAVEVISSHLKERPLATHVQDWIDAAYYPRSTHGEAYARFVMHYMGMPTRLRLEFNRFMKDKNLWCTIRGHRWKVIGTTHDGAIHVASSDDAAAVTDYVYVMDCSEWGNPSDFLESAPHNLRSMLHWELPLSSNNVGV